MDFVRTKSIIAIVFEVAFGLSNRLTLTEADWDADEVLFSNYTGDYAGLSCDVWFLGYYHIWKGCGGGHYSAWFVHSCVNLILAMTRDSLLLDRRRLSLRTPHQSFTTLDTSSLDASVLSNTDTVSYMSWLFFRISMTFFFPLPVHSRCCAAACICVEKQRMLPRCPMLAWSLHITGLVGVVGFTMLMKRIFVDDF